MENNKNSNSPRTPEVRFPGDKLQNEKKSLHLIIQKHRQNQSNRHFRAYKIDNH